MAVNSRLSRVIRQEHPPLLVGVLVAGLSVAAITALIFPLRQVSPASSNGVALPARGAAGLRRAGGCGSGC